MASVDADRAPTVVGRIERAIRRTITKGILADIAQLRATGVRVHLVTPGPADLQAMGLNLMDPSKRTAVLETARSTAADQLRRQFAARRGSGERPIAGAGDATTGGVSA
jgi:NTE family protein